MNKWICVECGSENCIDKHFCDCNNIWICECKDEDHPTQNEMTSEYCGVCACSREMGKDDLFDFTKIEKEITRSFKNEDDFE